jgi:hypothetical protein
VARKLKRELEHGRRSDTTSFRRLVEDKISVDEYVKRLDERVRDRLTNEEASRRAAADAEPHPG